MRINEATKSGGIFGVFRQDAAETQRTVVLSDLDPERMYSVRLAPEGKEVLKATGKILMEKGFIVPVENEIDGKIFEVTTE